MKLKNYTTGIEAEKSIMEIEKILAQFGASHIMKEYLSDGTATSLVFRLNNNSFRIPANVDGVQKALGKSGRIPMQKKRDEAYRVAWRIIKDWVHAQLSIIYSGQAQPEQVMLPYLWDGKQTLYHRYKEGRLQLEVKE